MGKLGLKFVFWKSISSHIHAFLFLIFNSLRCVFKNQVIFSKKMFFQIFDWSNLFFDQSKFLLKFSVSFCLFWSIENRKWAFLKVRSWPVQSIFFKKFSNFPLSLRLGKAPQQFFVVFLLYFCKVFLSISQYVHYTLSFFHLFPVLHALEDYFQTMHKLGVLTIQAKFCVIDQWVLLIYCYIHDLCWLIWSMWGIGMFSKF